MPGRGVTTTYAPSRAGGTLSDREASGSCSRPGSGRLAAAFSLTMCLSHVRGLLWPWRVSTLGRTQGFFFAAIQARAASAKTCVSTSVAAAAMARLRRAWRLYKDGTWALAEERFLSAARQRQRAYLPISRGYPRFCRAQFYGCCGCKWREPAAVLKARVLGGTLHVLLAARTASISQNMLCHSPACYGGVSREQRVFCLSAADIWRRMGDFRCRFSVCAALPRWAELGDIPGRAYLSLRRSVCGEDLTERGRFISIANAGWRRRWYLYICHILLAATLRYTRLGDLFSPLRAWFLWRRAASSLGAIVLVALRTCLLNAFFCSGVGRGRESIIMRHSLDGFLFYQLLPFLAPSLLPCCRHLALPFFCRLCIYIAVADILHSSWYFLPLYHFLIPLPL